MSIKGRCAAKGCKNNSSPGRCTCNKAACIVFMRDAQRVWRARVKLRQQGGPPTLCGMEGCEQAAEPGKKFCGLVCKKASNAARQARWKAEQVRPLREAKIARVEEPISDGYYCGGCRFLKSCPGQERGVQCIGGIYRECAPWTGAPRLKVRA